MANFKFQLFHGTFEFGQGAAGGENHLRAETGTCVLGGRRNQQLNSLDISSSDWGKTLTGTMTYEGEGPIGFRAQQTSQNHYNVEEQWGGQWHPGGFWTIGLRPNQLVIKMTMLPVGTAGTQTVFWGHVTYADGKPLSGGINQVD